MRLIPSASLERYVTRSWLIALDASKSSRFSQKRKFELHPLSGSPSHSG